MSSTTPSGSGTTVLGSAWSPGWGGPRDFTVDGLIAAGAVLGLLVGATATALVGHLV